MGFNDFNASNDYNQATSQPTGYANLDSIFNPGRNNQNTPRVDKNFRIVTSLQEALSKEAPYNSKGLYVHQDGEYEFEVFTDLNGRKTYEIFKRVNCTHEKDATSIPKNEYEELKSKILKLEEAVYGKSTNDSTNGNAEMQ